MYDLHVSKYLSKVKKSLCTFKKQFSFVLKEVQKIVSKLEFISEGQKTADNQQVKSKLRMRKQNKKTEKTGSLTCLFLKK